MQTGEPDYLCGPFRIAPDRQELLRDGAAVALGSLVSLVGLALWLGIDPVKALDDGKRPSEILESDFGPRT